MTEKYSYFMSDSLFTTVVRESSVQEAPAVNDSINSISKLSSRQVNDIYDNANDESKLIEDSSDEDDDRFYDALDEYEKNVYSIIKHRRQSIDHSRDDRKKKEQSDTTLDKFKRKLLLVVEFKGLAVSVFQAQKNSESLKRRLSSESKNSAKEKIALLKLQLHSCKVGLVQNTDSLNAAFTMRGLDMMHLDNRVLYSKYEDANEIFEIYEECKSSRSVSNNQSNSEIYQRTKNDVGQFCVVSFVQNNNKIIESHSVLSIKLAVAYFDITHK